MADLDGMVALVTGGSRGIGRAIAMTLAAEGAAVVVTGRDQAALAETCTLVQASGAPCHAMVCDVGDDTSVRATFAAARAALGPIDILVNNAGVTASVKFADTDDATWDRIMRINVTGAFYTCRAAVPDMLARRRGRIINVASIAALAGLAFSSAYSASKHALLGLTRSLALELGRSGITANALCPGWVETDMLHDAIAAIVAKTGRTPEQAREGVLALSGQARAVTPEEVAAVALRLAGPAGAQVNGEAITIL